MSTTAIPRPSRVTSPLSSSPLPSSSSSSKSKFSSFSKSSIVSISSKSKSKSTSRSQLFSARTFLKLCMAKIIVALMLLMYGYMRIHDKIHDNDSSAAAPVAGFDSEQYIGHENGKNNGKNGERVSTRSPLLPCHPVPSISHLSQSEARDVLSSYIPTVFAEQKKPRLVPVLNQLYRHAQARNETFVTVQIGGMDGTTGDPLQRFTEWNADLSHWLPVVVEPVPENFDKLVLTYGRHMLHAAPAPLMDHFATTKDNLPYIPPTANGVKCPHVLHQLINYDPQRLSRRADSSSSSLPKCPFCHFDHDKPQCAEQPDWLKYETGSMECETQAKQKCFKASQFPCTSIRAAIQMDHALDAAILSTNNIPSHSNYPSSLSSKSLSDLSTSLSNNNTTKLHPSNVILLQIDVEGFEQQLLEGYFNEISSTEYPPVLNFESKILNRRGQLEPVKQFLISKGYSLFQKHVDILALLLLNETMDQINNES